MEEPGSVRMPAGFPAAAVLIGASTGGPPVVERILRVLPADFPVPVVVCQHMSEGFVGQWAERLDPLCWLSVAEAVDGERLERGRVYLAPIGRHLRLARDGRTAVCRFEPDAHDAFFCPSIDRLFSSGVEALGSRALGVLLTGLGSDGAEGLLAMRRGGCYTIVESPETAVASSMPASACALGAAVETVATDALPAVLVARAQGVFA